MPDGSKRTLASGSTYKDLAKSIGHRLAKEAFGAKSNGKLVDLSACVENGAEVEIITFQSDEGKQIYWHSSAHLMAQAVKQLFPDAQVTIGPSIDGGFYYDFAFRPFTLEDMEAIEKRMAELVKQNLPIERKVMPRDEAIEFFRSIGEEYKVEILSEIPQNETISFYSQGDFIDLCRGPHLPTTKYIKAFKLISIAGAYWRGDEQNPQLQRIYGTSYPKKSQLNEHLKRLEEAKRRDHRKLGKQLDLYSVSSELGSGLILWHPKGALIRYLIESFWQKEHLKNGYDLLNSPHIAKRDLWHTSGHLDFYEENMYAPMSIDEIDYQLKPMNCPFHLLIYKTDIRSYRDLPLRWAELGTVYRYERSGVLHGLMRVRGFTQDDAHIFCQPKQLDAEIEKALDFSLYMLKSFGFVEFDVYLSTRPEKFVGDVENWDIATAALRNGLEKSGLDWKIDPGEGVFYGPKIDIKIKDVLGRSWQCSTIQVDFNEPERFDIFYIGSDGEAHRPIMIHRALLGSLERFFGVLIEHYAGAFPMWLAPVQVKILPITDKQHKYASELHQILLEHDIRTELDDRNEKVNLKIREAEVHKVPYMLIVGGRESESRTASLRRHGKGNLGAKSIDSLIAMFKDEIESKR